MATAVDFITILHLCYCYSLVLADHPALTQWPLLSKYTASRLTFRLLPTNRAVMLNIISTLCNELNYHQVTVTCWVSGSLRQVYLIWYAHFFCWHYNKVLSCSVPYKSLVSYIAKIHQSLKVSMFNPGTEHTHGVQHTYSYRNVLLLSVTGSNVDAVLRHVFVVVAKTSHKNSSHEVC